ncbi:hypothetical protein BC629DRAFT_1554295 [Irpex lacteus]|nr:hypothetical protein BC629DRAFT_1554295 [Irpex lacteus]
MGSSATSELARFYLELVPLLNPFDRYRSLLPFLSLSLVILMFVCFTSSSLLSRLSLLHPRLFSVVPSSFYSRHHYCPILAFGTGLVLLGFVRTCTYSFSLFLFSLDRSMDL